MGSNAYSLSLKAFKSNKKKALQRMASLICCGCLYLCPLSSPSLILLLLLLLSQNVTFVVGVCDSPWVSPSMKPFVIRVDASRVQPNFLWHKPEKYMAIVKLMEPVGTRMNATSHYMTAHTHSHTHAHFPSAMQMRMQKVHSGECKDGEPFNCQTGKWNALECISTKVHEWHNAHRISNYTLHWILTF